MALSSRVGSESDKESEKVDDWERNKRSNENEEDEKDICEAYEQLFH